MTTDAEAFFFLHDLITSYVKEKERVLSIQHGGGGSGTAAGAASKIGNPRDKSEKETPPSGASSTGTAHLDPLQVILKLKIGSSQTDMCMPKPGIATKLIRVVLTTLETPRPVF